MINRVPDNKDGIKKKGVIGMFVLVLIERHTAAAAATSTPSLKPLPQTP